MANEEMLNISETTQETIYVSSEEYKQLYEASLPEVQKWKQTFEKFSEENRSKINWFFEKAALLYGGKQPTEMRTHLMFNPNEGNVKGEPIKNFTGVYPELEKQTDAIYWMPKFDDVSNENYVKARFKGLLHEGEHNFMQGTQGTLHSEGYNKFLEKVNSDPKVNELKIKVFGENDGYMEMTNELLTVYLESLFEIAPAENSSKPTKMNFTNNEDTSFKVLYAAMYYQERDYPQAPASEGPYANLRRGYRKYSVEVLGKNPIAEELNIVDESTGKTLNDKKKTSPYEFQGKLPTKLLEEYLAEDKQIDKDFIVRLYEMALEYKKPSVESQNL